MRTLIIEDEIPAARRLEQQLKKLRPEVEILEVLDSVSSAIAWFDEHPAPDLVMMDIHLADGLSFDIFGQTQVGGMVIFTTAYDQYALRAFKVNSIDYLLKPIVLEDLEAALAKFEQLTQPIQAPGRDLMAQLLQTLQSRSFKERFIVKSGNALSYIQACDLRWCYVEDSMLFARMNDGKRHLLDYTLEQLEQQLDPKSFFRVNRQFLVHIEAVKRMHPYFNNRLKLELYPLCENEVIVSRDRVADFKRWVEG
jgi:DNA-binding LytR/AlgR family response regulator